MIKCLFYPSQKYQIQGIEYRKNSFIWPTGLLSQNVNIHEVYNHLKLTLKFLGFLDSKVPLGPTRNLLQLLIQCVQGSTSVTWLRRRPIVTRNKEYQVYKAHFVCR